MPILTPQQAQQLSEALVAAFKPGTLPWVVRASIGIELYVIVNAQQPFGIVVADLIRWIESRGSGTLEAFLRRAVAARPTSACLQTFLKDYDPDIAKERGAADLVKDFGGGLQILIDMQNDPHVRQTVGGFYADASATQRQIGLLVKYKGLHDALHELQLQLDAIIDALRNRGRTTLTRQASDLDRLVARARPLTTGLPTKAEEDDWIDTFAGCVQDIRSIVSPPSQPSLPPPSEAVIDQLRKLLSQARRINGLLAMAADALRLGSFAEALGALGDTLRLAPEQDSVRRLFEGARSVGVLRAQLDGLVAEHNEWNKFHTDLEVAENSDKYLPQDRIPKWDKFRNRLESLCEAYSDADWSKEISKALTKWIACFESAGTDEDKRRNGEIAFAEFQRACVYRFYDVDKELNTMCGQITDIAKSVGLLLTAIQSPAGNSH